MMKLWITAAAICLCALATVARAEAEKGLVADWQFQDGKGGVLQDAIPNGNNGDISGATWAKVGERFALQFNGKEAYVDCGTSETLTPTAAVTLEAWVNPASAPKGEPSIAGKYVNNYVITGYQGQFYWYIGSGGNNCHAPMKIGAWQHVVGVYDGEQMSLYINGARVASGKSAVKMTGAEGHFYMGCLNPGGQDTSYFNGMIGAVRLYSRALSDAEIAERYKKTVSSYPAVETEKGKGG